jgi:hypothetical protein
VERNRQAPKPIDARGLAQRLRRYEIRSTTVRIGEWHGKGYKREDPWDAWSRYLPPPEDDDDDDLGPPAQGSVTSVTTVTTDGRPCGICGNGFHPDPPSRVVCDRCRPQLAGTTT